MSIKYTTTNNNCISLFVVCFLYLVTFNAIAHAGQLNAELKATRGQQLEQTLASLAEQGEPISAEKLFSLQALSGSIVQPEMKIYSTTENPELSAFMDQAVLDLFQHSTLASQLCNLVGSNPQNYVTKLSISASAANKLQQHCISLYPNLPKAAFSMRTKSSIYWIFGMPTNFPIESWTTQSNEILLFFSDVPTVEQIYARLIHEYYVAHDAKHLLGRETFSVIADMTGFSATAGWFQSTQEQLHIPMGIYPMPLIKFSFATARAMVFEQAVLKQMFGDEVETLLPEYQILKKDPVDAVEIIGKSLFQLQDFLLPAESVFFGVKERRAYYQTLGYYVRSEEGLHNILNAYRSSSVKMIDQNTNERMTLAQWLILPVMDGGQFFARGPKPRIGGGFAEAKEKKSDSYVNILDRYKNKINQQHLDKLNKIIIPSQSESQVGK